MTRRQVKTAVPVVRFKDHMDSLEQELKEFIISALKLEDISPESIDVEAPLFVEGLGLDSLDALELGVGISKKYGIQLSNDPTENREIFASVKAMAAFIRRSAPAGE
jgi:acyl carrier protein